MRLKVIVTKRALIESRYCGYVAKSGRYYTKEEIADKTLIPAEEYVSPVSNCAVAIAVRALLPDALVYSASIWVTSYKNMTALGHPKEIMIPLPSEVESFITFFDKMTPAQRIEMKELEFWIDVPDELIDEIGIQEAYSIIKKAPELSLV